MKWIQKCYHTNHINFSFYQFTGKLEIGFVLNYMETGLIIGVNILFWGIEMTIFSKSKDNY